MKAFVVDWASRMALALIVPPRTSESPRAAPNELTE